MRARRSRQQGIAMIAALWITVLLTVVASGFAFSMRNEALAARNALSLAQARAAADGAVERTAFELGRPRNVNEAWKADGQRHAWTDGDIAFVAAATDESAKIDLNAAPDALLKGLFQNVGGVDAETAQRLVEAVLDWRDVDDLKHPNGAEAADYRSAGMKWVPANGPFESVGELSRVMGMTPALYSRIAGSVTVYAGQPGINTATASRTTLLAIPNVTPEQVDAFLQLRTEALAAKLQVPAFPAAQGYATAAVPVWRITGQATLPDGVTFVREAVLRPSQDPKRPVIALLWEEGARSTPPPAPADAQADTNNTTQADGTRTH